VSYVVLDEFQTDGRYAVEVQTDCAITQLHLMAAGCWPAWGARLRFDQGTGRVLLDGERADERLRDEAESVLLGMRDEVGALVLTTARKRR
jgi:hypothetical protein